MIKKLLFLSLAILFIISLSACTKKNDQENSVHNSLLNNQTNMTNNNEDQLNDDRDFDLGEFEAQETPEIEEEELVISDIKPFPGDFENLFAQGYNQVIIKTNLGDIKLNLFGQDSPNTVNNFLNLAKLGFYNGTKFHRVIEGFMIQAGDPNTKTDNTAIYGTGGPGYTFADEINSIKLVKGSLAMANAGPNTNGSQFFIVTAESTPWLDGAHTNFGEVVQGISVVETIEKVETNQRDLPLNDVIIREIVIVKE